MLTETVIFAIVAGAVTLISLAIRYAFMSKCDSGSCLWGCIRFHRNTNQEKQDVSNESKREIENK